MSRSTVCVSVLWAIVAGCDPCVDVDGPFASELGTGVDTFIPLADDALVPYVRGPQGGTHVDGSVRVEGLYLPAANASPIEALCQVSFTLATEDTQVGGFTAAPRAFAVVDEAARVGEHVGEPVVFFEDASTWVGATLRLWVEVKDRCGHRVTDERRITITDGAG
jgi:hypothetical protein